MQNHWPLHKMSITPNIVMICIDIQGEEHHCLEEQGILGNIGEQKLEIYFRIKIWCQI
jgi:hypothetical protein